MIKKRIGIFMIAACFLGMAIAMGLLSFQNKSLTEQIKASSLPSSENNAAIETLSDELKNANKKIHDLHGKNNQNEVLTAAEIFIKQYNTHTGEPYRDYFLHLKALTSNNVYQQILESADVQDINALVEPLNVYTSIENLSIYYTISDFGVNCIALYNSVWNYKGQAVSGRSPVFTRFTMTQDDGNWIITELTETRYLQGGEAP